MVIHYIFVGVNLSFRDKDLFIEEEEEEKWISRIKAYLPVIKSLALLTH